MRRSSLLAVVGLFIAIAWTTSSAPFLRVVKNASPDESLLRNGDFEQARDANAVAWSASPRG